MIQKYLYFSLAILFFGMGVYSWKITKSGLQFPSDNEMELAARYSDLSHLLYVGETPIVQEDIDWEFDLHTRGIAENEDLTQIPEMVGDPKVVLGALRERLMADLIERKLLYQFIKLDREFNIADPALYTDCILPLL